MRRGRWRGRGSVGSESGEGRGWGGGGRVKGEGELTPPIHTCCTYLHLSRRGKDCSESLHQFTDFMSELGSLATHSNTAG